jgi:adenylosuccinate lyase
VDTALCLLLREALSVILEDLQEVMEVLKDKAFQYKETPMIGRTHGVHAEPITFGFKLALWYDEMKRNRRRLLGALKTISVGKISGAVGTYANVPPQVEEYVCQKLGLIPMPSSQVISRDRHGEMMAVLALLGSSIEKIALEIRHLQRTEVLEVEEPFSEAQKGSSAMPHKRNPVVAENLCGLARLLRGYLISALENIPLWHERDISHSSVERVILPDATILLDFMLSRLKELLQGMRVYPSRMYQNLLMTKGLIFSEALMLKLIKKGFLRKEAYGIVQRNALKAWEKGEDFKDLIKKDQQVKALLSEDEIEECFSLTKHLEHINFVFDKVFEDSEV